MEIYTATWAVGGGLDQTLRPWHLWATNPRVANRLSNFKNFRGKLHIKVILNGNSFYWSRALLSYMPYPGQSPWYRTAGDSDILSASQRPHIYLDPSTSQGGHMVLPFFCRTDCIDMTATNSFMDFGELWLRSFAPLRQAQSLSQGIGLKMYAWVEDIHLTSPTSVSMFGLSPQAGDEYGDGPISRPANIVSKISGALESVPAIAPLAMATNMAARGVGNIAASFGYSRPRNIQPTNSVRIWQTGDLALSDTNVTSNSLSMVAKNEVTLDPRTVGLGDADEMDFKYLAQKESYMFSTSWRLDDLADSVIISMPVTPLLRKVNSSPLITVDGVILSPMGLVALPFKFWRGSIKYRFQVVGSGYHKGRILAVWDPVLGSSTPETNIVYSKIIDIAETKDFSITIGWGNERPGLEVGPMTVASTFNSVINYTPITQQHNGVLTLYVLTPLVTTGADTNSVTVLTSVSSPELEVWCPEADELRVWSAFPRPEPATVSFQAGNTMSDEVGQSENAAPEALGLNEYAGGKAVDITLPAILAGESIVSFRQLLKRFNFERAIGRSWTADPSKFTLVAMAVKSYPLFRAYLADGLNTYNGSSINATPTTPYNFITACFAGWRGSVRMKVFPTMPPDLMPNSMLVSRGDNFSLGSAANQFDNSFNNYALFKTEYDESAGGTQVTNAVQGNVLDFEIPYYAYERFASTYSGNSISVRGLGARINAITFPDGTTRVKNQTFDLYKAVGEDYNLFFFTGSPTWWFVAIVAD